MVTVGNLTTNLSRSEFACQCGCGFDTVDFELVNAIQEAVVHFTGVYQTAILVEITGPNRCKEHNEEVQKEYNPNYVPYSSKTTHIDARAGDHKFFIKATGVQINPDEVATYYEDKYGGKWGIGRYSNRTHLDTRSTGPARWDTT